MKTTTAALALSLSLAAACTPPPAPAPATTIEVERGTTMTTVAPDATIQRARRRVVDVLAHDGELLAYADLRLLRRSPLYDVVLATALEQLPAEAKDVCTVDLLAGVDDAAMAWYRVDRDEPVVALGTRTPGELMGCLRVLLSLEEQTIVGDGHKGWTESQRWRPLVAAASEDVVVVGRRLEVHRALERGQGKITSRSGPLLERLELDQPDFAFAVSAELHEEHVAEAWLRSSYTNDHLRARGLMRLRGGPHRSAEQTATEAEEEIVSVRDKLVELARAVLPGEHALVTQLEAVQITRSAEVVSLTADVSADASLREAAALLFARQALTRHTSEARNTIGAISRGATAAYERELALPTSPNIATHVLCKSSTTVPATVPRGVAFQPQPGDFDSGDTTTGWRCLKFGLTQPFRYQYAYRAGGNYKGPARGLPDPGPKGFEVSAEGDLDGDGKTSLFTRVGRVDPASGNLRVDAQIYVADELE